MICARLARSLLLLKRKSGATAIRTLLIFLIVMLLIAFGSQVFMLYTTSATVYSSCQNAMVELASRNLYTQEMFEGMREFQMELDLDDPYTDVLTDDELSAVLIRDLDLVKGESNSLVRLKSESVAYTISNLSVNAVVKNETGYSTVTYTAYFELVMPVASYWNYGQMVIPMQIESTYRAKL